MKADEDLELAELLAARLCHDLAGPLAAIGNGMELLSDPDFGPDPEAAALVSDSADQAAAALRFLRSAFGAASEQEGEPAHLRSLSEAWLKRRSVQLDWRLGVAPLRPEVGRLLLNLLMLAAESLLRGGTLALSVETAPAAQVLTLRAEGRDLDLRPELRRALDATGAEGLGPRGAQAYFLRRLIDRLGGDLEFDLQPGRHLALEVVLPE